MKICHFHTELTNWLKSNQLDRLNKVMINKSGEKNFFSAGKAPLLDVGRWLQHRELIFSACYHGTPVSRRVKGYLTSRPFSFCQQECKTCEKEAVWEAFRRLLLVFLKVLVQKTALILVHSISHRGGSGQVSSPLQNTHKINTRHSRLNNELPPPGKCVRYC